MSTIQTKEEEFECYKCENTHNIKMFSRWEKGFVEEEPNAICKDCVKEEEEEEEDRLCPCGDGYKESGCPDGCSGGCCISCCGVGEEEWDEGECFKCEKTFKKDLNGWGATNLWMFGGINFCHNCWDGETSCEVENSVEGEDGDMYWTPGDWTHQVALELEL